MAVYFAPRQQNYWGRAISDLGTGLLGKLFGDMMDRTTRAKEIERNRGLYADVAESMRGGNPSRENVLDALGRHGVSPEQAKSFFDFYGNQFKNQDDLARQDAVAQRTSGLNFDVRNDPNQAMQSGMFAQAYGLKPEEVLPFAYPNYQSGHFDAGNKEIQYAFNPVTGKFENQEHVYGIDPTKKYQSDADTEQANISAGASRYVADKSSGASRYVADRNFEGKKLGVEGGKPAKALTLADKKNLDGMVAQAIQMSPDVETFETQLDLIAGDNPEAQNYVQTVSRNPKYMFKNNVGFYETKLNPYAKREIKGDVPEPQPKPQPEQPGTNPSKPVVATNSSNAAMAGAIDASIKKYGGDINAVIADIDSSRMTPQQKAEAKSILYSYQKGTVTPAPDASSTPVIKTVANSPRVNDLIEARRAYQEMMIEKHKKEAEALGY